MQKASVAPTLSVALLGGIRLSYGNRPITTVDTPRLQSLLAYLVLHRGTPQPRQHLAFILWPDSTEAHARASLRNLVHTLRRALPDADHFLRADNAILEWVVDAPFTLDVADLENTVARAAQSEQAGDHHAMRLALEHVVQLYHGDLLPSCYDDWIVPERERLRQLYVGVLERSLAMLEAQQDYRTAIDYARRLLRFDPLHEEAYRQLMRLNARTGDRVGVLRTYQTCVAVLKHELDVEPSAATQAAYTQCSQRVVPEPGIATIEQRATSAPDNLPSALTSFIGRERETVEVKRLLAHTRLLTLTGPGGCGKTRLALNVAHELLAERAFADGVWWVELAALTDEALVLKAVASALHIVEQAGHPLLETVAEALRHKHLLLVLDNCEHLLSACQQVAHVLLSAAPELRLITTSREVLNIMGETTWLVPSLTLPLAHAEWKVLSAHSPDAQHGFASEAVRLFVERAQAVLPTFKLTQKNAPVAAEICRRLDGIPLALELAAARVKVLSVEQIAQRLDQRFNLLSAGSRTALPRHQSLRAAMDWSYELLTDWERILLRRLAIFAGGFTLEAAEAICVDVVPAGPRERDRINREHILELLSSLLDKSLVMVETQAHGVEVRYRLLETIREYARDKLSASGETQALAWQHAQWFVRLAEIAELELYGPQQMMWLARLEQELDNVRAALVWLLETEGADSKTCVNCALRLANAINRFWFGHGHISEGRRWLERGLLRSAGQITPARARALAVAGWLARHQADLVQAKTLLQESVSVYQALDDSEGLSHALDSLGDVALSAAEPLQAETFYQESLALRRVVGNKHWIALSLNSLADAIGAQGDDVRARAYYMDGLSLFRELGDKRGMALSLSGLGHVALDQGDLVQAIALLLESVSLFEELGNQLDVALCLEALAQIAALQGEARSAVQLTGAADALRQRLGAPRTLNDEARIEHYLSLAQSQLDGVSFSVARAEGQALSLEQAVAAARQRLQALSVEATQT